MLKAIAYSKKRSQMWAYQWLLILRLQGFGPSRGIRFCGGLGFRLLPCLLDPGSKTVATFA